MLYSRKLEQEKMEAPGEHAADTSYMCIHSDSGQAGREKNY
jgi:hypothetical protein